MSSTPEAVVNVADSNITELIGNLFLYSASMFVELTVVLVCLMFMYRAMHSIICYRSFTRPTDPVNLHKWMYFLFASTIFLRAVMDAVILLVWDEVTLNTVQTLIMADRIMTVVAMIPFIGFAYLLFKSGPSIDFQLLRQPIPTDLLASWRQIRKPVAGMATIMILTALVTISKAL